MTIAEMFSLIGGIGLFLFGMTIMSTGLRNACGDNLQTILEKATKNKIMALFVGIGMTVLIQSSSATDVMVIGFVNSGLMQLSQAIGVIMGANIGTTITAQITAFNISTFTPLILFAGAVMYLFLKRTLHKSIGSILLGFGMLFQGITMMKAAIAPLAQTPGFVRFLSTLDNPFLAVLFGVGFTALLQSSSSSTVIFQAFAIQGVLDYNTAVYLIIGAAIGSVTPNLLASLTANRNGKRSAILNLLFNLIRAGILVTLINVFPRILTAIQSLSPNDVGRQIANTHTIFAIIAVAIVLPFSDYIIKLANKIIPVLPEENEAAEERKLKYMTGIITNIPASVAVSQAHNEIVRMGQIAVKNLDRALKCFFDYDSAKAESVRTHEETVNILNHSIADQMVQLGKKDMSSEQTRRISMMTIAVTDFERLSDHAENIVEYAENLISRKVKFSETAEKELREMADNTLKVVHMAMNAFETEDYSHLDEMEGYESIVDDEQHTLINNHIERIMNNQCDPVSGVIFSEIVTDLERCSDHGINIAYALKERPQGL